MILLTTRSLAATAAAMLLLLLPRVSAYHRYRRFTPFTLRTPLRLSDHGGAISVSDTEGLEEMADCSSAIQPQVPQAPSSSSAVKKSSQQSSSAVAGIEIKEEDIRESFAKGSGPGGQSINKTMNRVRIVHIPTGIEVVCQEARDLSTNRKLARRLLKEKLDFMVNGMDSKMGRVISKKRKCKSKSASRARAKYQRQPEAINSNTDNSDRGEESSVMESGDVNGDNGDEGDWRASDCNAQVRVLMDQLGQVCSVCSSLLIQQTDAPPSTGVTPTANLIGLSFPSTTGGSIEVSMSEEMMLRADADDLIELFGEDFRELLSLSSGSASNKTISVSFLETLGKIKLDDRKSLLYDLTLQIGPLKLFAVPASFTSLPFDSTTAPLVSCTESACGDLSDLPRLCATDGDYYRGKIVCLRRGDTTFATKLQFAKEIGAAGCVVFNTLNVFPFIMMDSKAELGGGSSDIPIFMISKEDSVVVEKLLQERMEGSSSKLFSTASMVCNGILELSCSICQEPMAAEEEVLKLPCRHCYHAGCVHTWLLRNNSCPMCRTQMPAASTREVASRREQANVAASNQPYFI